MCTDKEHGGKRCLNDTSAARRQRRKASQVRNKSQSASLTVGTTAESSTVPSSQFTEQVEILKKLIGSAPPAEVSQLDYDMYVEKKITEFGMALGVEAERIADFTPEALNKEIENLDSLYSEVAARRRKNEQKANEFLDELNEYEDRHELRHSWDVNQAVKRIKDYKNDEGQALISRAQEFVDEFAAVAEDSKAVDKIYNNERLRIRNHYSGKLTAAYQSLISGVRPVGGVVKYAPESDAEAVELVNRTVSKHYPTEWLQHHNEHSEVILRSAATRPNYNYDSNDGGKDVEVAREKRIEFVFISSSTVEGHDKLMNTINETFSDTPRTHFTFSSPTVQETFTKVFYSTTEEEIYDEEKHGVIAENEREAAGWEHRPSLASLIYLSTAESLEHAEKIATQPYWVRKSTTMTAPAKVLTLHNDEGLKKHQLPVPDVGNEKEAITYHEFGHRMEDVMPDKKLTRYEHAFLKRRTGKTEENFNQGMVTALGTDELYHNSDFVYRYTGRAYSNVDFTEVFTTGIEALYGGNLGGLVGNSNNYSKPDLDHRGFVLGVLATL